MQILRYHSFKVCFGGTLIWFGWGCAAGFAKVLPVTSQTKFGNVCDPVPEKQCSIVLDFNLL